MKELSVIVVTYKSGKHICPCLDALVKANDIGTRLEVLIVDNEVAGAEKRRQNLEAYRSQLDLKYIVNTRNGGYGQGNNLGIHHALAALVLIMNPDVRLTGATPGRICSAFSQNEKLALLGMRQTLGNGLSGRSFLWASALPAGLLGSTLLWFSNRCGLFFPRWECIQGSCFALRKSMFESVGMFDESVFMYGEERDIHSRLRKLRDVRIDCDWKMSYQHLTDHRDFNFDTKLKTWEVSARWCRNNGISTGIFWERIHRHLTLLLLWHRLRAGHRNAKTIEFLEKQKAFVDIRRRENRECGGTLK